MNTDIKITNSNKIIFFIVLLSVSLLTQLSFPWWIGVVIAPFVIAFFLSSNQKEAFFLSFISLFIIWFLGSLWSHIPSKGILTKQVAEILPLGGNSILLILVTSLIGGLVGGISAWSGACFKVAFR